jgi:hypothetical protein
VRRVPVIGYRSSLEEKVLQSWTLPFCRPVRSQRTRISEDPCVQLSGTV